MKYKNPAWKDFPRNMNNKLHSICSYMAMFPAKVPHYFIEEYSEEGDIVLDPFSGRGTTILEACFMKRIGIGNDKNPLAYVLTKSKAHVPSKKRIQSRIDNLMKEFIPDKIDISNEEQKIKMIFCKNTLKQLVFLKHNLNWKTSNIDAFVTSLVLGIMHGNSEGFLSLSMPNTFSMSPNYVKGYIKKHHLQKPNRDVFSLVAKKLNRCYQSSPNKGKVFNQDVRRIKRIKDSSIDLIITSPPYTRVIRYGQSNWIRLWFLGETGKEVDEKLFFTQSKEKYVHFMFDTLKEMKRVLKPGKKVVLVIGDVNDRITKKPFNLAGIVWKKSAKPLGFKLVEPIQADIIGANTKVSKIWGDKKGDATRVDRVLVLEK